MSTIITEQYEHWCANQIISGKPARPDTFVFAYIPGQDESAEIPCDEILPDESMIQYRAPVTQYGLLSPNATAFSIILDTTVGDFEYNWIGLLNEESGVLCMIAHTPRQQKIKTANGVQGNNLIRTFSMEFDGAAAAMHIDVSADVWQIDFTARLAGMDEARRLLAFDHYGEAAFLGDGFQVSYQDGTATVAAGIGYVGGLRVSLREPYSLPAAVGDTLWIDASWQGFVTGEWSTVFTFCARKEHAPYTDGNGFQHFVAPLAKLTAGGPQDLRPQTPDEEQSNALAEHEKSRRHPDATLTEKGFAQYSNATDSDAEDRAATSKAVKIAMDNANARLAKNRNGSDIPNKPLFIENVGLKPTVDKAESAVQRAGDTMTGELKIRGVNALRIFNEAFGLIFRRSEECLHLIPTSEGQGENGDIGPLRPISINLRQGDVVIGDRIGIGNENNLGEKSLTLCDSNTGFKWGGRGVINVFAEGHNAFRFTKNGVLALENLSTGNLRKFTLSCDSSSTKSARFNLWGNSSRPVVAELGDDSGWHFYSQRNTDNSITFAVNGQMVPSNYGNFDARYQQRNGGVQDVRYGSEMYYNPGGNQVSWTFRSPSGHGLSGINVQETGSNSADNIGGVYYRPLQKLINGTWYNVASV
ncbi:phage tail protein [Escherichia coli]|uniref:phage tail-collar fiber domain-containing protein n=7 Tax=Escherichia coli TaxID=562 RepID=UPI00145BBC37|nr:phage tail protein [Escherichia coli]EII1145093.1 phage tail protein [Escherichia coli O121]EER3119652.1 phage tail protein [Escherichia coli]EER6574674.1 phage tail protein [Escherichia coli]EES4369876.1 phage tail protein [Escherichia coli]EEU4079146.1 phage tail protein [Escherichia coli]